MSKSNISTMLVGFIMIAASFESAYSQNVENSSYKTFNGERVLRHEVTIPAPIDSIWYAFTTAEGMTSWMVPLAAIELKTGGRIETSYDRKAKLGDPRNIHNTVLSFIPGKMFSFKIGLTDQFPEEPRETSTLFYVIFFDEVEKDTTRVEGSMLGWGEGDQWDQVYEKFEWGNAYTFEQLYKRFTEGPVDWTKKEQPTVK
jgi:uncharacterized protein YndB with AHSA1/START domain